MNEISWKDVFQKFGFAYSLLADDESKTTFLERVNWIITGDYSYIDKTIDRVMPGIPHRDKAGMEGLFKLIPADSHIVMYGAGTFAKRYINEFIRDGRLVAVCDSDKNKWGESLSNMTIISPNELKSNYSGCVIVVSVVDKAEEIRQYLQEQLGFDKHRIFDIEPYATMKTTGDTYFVQDIVHLGDEVFVDDGCKNMDTSFKLASLCNLKKVYAFEPDPQNYEICKGRKDELNAEVVLYPYGTWDKKDTLSFSATNDGCSHITDSGETKIDVRSIDEMIPKEENVTFIKMDVEGAELNSLIGAANTIRRCKPKLAICIYHKPEDTIELLLYVYSLNPEYKFYIRHHSNYWNETVLYAL